MIKAINLGDNSEKAVTVEEIRSFVTIFRRLYMDKERANFQKVCVIFVSATKGHAISDWVDGAARECQKHLDGAPETFLLSKLGHQNGTFSCKRLIDVFIYTQYAHQPDKQVLRQFQKCLREVGNDKPLLTWLFLSELWKCGRRYWNVGKQIVAFYDEYCQWHKITPKIIEHISENNPGIGTLEKADDRRHRIMREKAECLALALWEKAGRPNGGHMAFITQAFDQLKAAIHGAGSSFKGGTNNSPPEKKEGQ